MSGQFIWGLKNFSSPQEISNIDKGSQTIMLIEAELQNRDGTWAFGTFPLADHLTTKNGKLMAMELPGLLQTHYPE